jgi:hypothetical protein
MLYEVAGTKCSATSLLSSSNFCEVQNCVKCAELQRFQQALNELNSVQLIIQMLKKHHFKEDTVAVSIQQMEAAWEVDKSWNVVTIRGLKRRTEGKMKSRHNELINSKEQR